MRWQGGADSYRRFDLRDIEIGVRINRDPDA